MEVFINDSGHMTKMATMPINVDNPLNVASGILPIIVCINHGLHLMTCVMAQSDLILKAFQWEK